MFSVLITSTMKSDPSGTCALGSACGVPTSAAATAPEGGSAEGLARPAPIGNVVVEVAALAMLCGTATAVAAPATATPAKNFRRFTSGRGSFRAMVFSHRHGGLGGRAGRSICGADTIAGAAAFPGGERPVRHRFLRNSHAPARAALPVTPPPNLN